MFNFIGAAVVYGFAAYGLWKWQQKPTTQQQNNNADTSNSKAAQ